MAGTKIMSAAGMFLDTVGCKSVSTSSGTDDGFSQIMDRTKQDLGGNEPKLKSENTIQTKSPVKVAKNSQKEAACTDQSKAEEAAKQDTSAKGDVLEETDEVDESVKEAVLGAAEEIEKMVKEELDLTEEELYMLMETLGLTQVDLLRPETMQQLVVAAAGDGDSLSILTDEGLYQSVQQLMDATAQITAGLQEQLGLSESGKELEAILEQMEVSPEPELLEELPSTEENSFAEGFGQDIGALTEAEAEPETVITVEEKAAEEKDTAAAAGEAFTGKAENTDALQQNNDTVMPERKESSEEPAKDTGSGSYQENTSFLHTAAKPDETFWNDESVQPETEAFYEQPDVERIMSQITERVKVTAGEELSEIEMQLQPETLGTLRIHLTSKEGAVTAQFTAENESVRSVLEAQTVQLKENLNQQGIKVEAVEVTVANQGFERSFAQNDEQSGKYEEPKKRGIRRIQLSDELTLDEMELTEEERIAAEMMEMNGNTVDYMA